MGVKKRGESCAERLARSRWQCGWHKVGMHVRLLGRRRFRLRLVVTSTRVLFLATLAHSNSFAPFLMVMMLMYVCLVWCVPLKETEPRILVLAPLPLVALLLRLGIVHLEYRLLLVGVE